MKEHGICAKCKKSVGCPYADDRITGCKNFVLEPELKLTNKEWIRQCDAEQLAECIIGIDYGTDDKDIKIAKLVEWLKQPHTTIKE